MKIDNLLIVGGTHGNERTGVFLLKQLERSMASYEGIQIDYLLANPKAVELNKRFVDKDLNRCFALSELEDNTLKGYEYTRAKDIYQQCGSKGADARYPFIIDLHTTTANMGVSILLNHDTPLNRKLAAYIQSQVDNVYISITAKEHQNPNEDYYLYSLAPNGFTIEVGPVANGVYRHETIEQTKATLMAGLKYLSMHNQGKPPKVAEQIEVFEHLDVVNYPLDDQGEICATVHQDLQDRDYELIQKGDAIFYTLDGKTIYFEQDYDQAVYGIFINEAAYYYVHGAFALVTKHLVETGCVATDR